MTFVFAAGFMFHVAQPNLAYCLFVSYKNKPFQLFLITWISKKEREMYPCTKKKEIIEFMEKHPALKSGKFTNNFTFKKAQFLWQELENRLNCFPGGAKKDWRQWRKTWQDMKSSAKKKNAIIKKYMRGTGGGPVIKTDLTDEEKKVVDIMGSVAIEGDPKVLESNCEFSFVRCGETEIILDPDHDYIKMQVVDTPEISNNSCNKLLDVSSEISNNICNELLDVSSENQDNYILASSTSLPNKTGKTPENNVNSGNNVTMETNNFTSNKNRKKPVRVQRLDNALSANNKLVELTESQANFKEKYYSTKLKLFERDVAAKEKIAVALENVLAVLTRNSADQIL